MRLPLYLHLYLSAPFAAALVHRAAYGIQVTSHVFPLVAAPGTLPGTPSSRHLHRRRNGRRQVPGLVPSVGQVASPLGGLGPVVGGLAPGGVASPLGGASPVVIWSPMGPVAPLVAVPPPVAVSPLVAVPPPVAVSPFVAIPPSVVASPPIAAPSLPAGLRPPHTTPDATDTLDDSAGSSPDALPVATIEQPVDTLGGRVYMTNVTLAGRPYTLILDTGSSDTWIAASSFQCTSRLSHARLPQRSCGFGELYDVVDSASYAPIPGRAFGVRYSDGEYLMGDMGVEELRVGDVDGGIGGLTVKQTIGVVERGWWMGDGRSSGLMGLAFPTLASNYRDLNYTTVVGSLFETHQIPPIFSLALSRPTRQDPTAGGIFAIGGIPDIPFTAPFVRVPITPIYAHIYAFYSIPIDGFAITPPRPSSPTAPPHAPNPPTTIPPFANTSSNSRAQGGTQPLSMVIDSGSTLLYLPDATADYIATLFDPPARYIPSSNTYLTTCTALQPRLGIVIAGTTFYINPKDMLSAEGRGKCSLAVQRMGDGDAVLGDAWLKNVLVVFNVGERWVGVAGREE